MPAGSLAFNEIRVGCNVARGGIALRKSRRERPAFHVHSIERLERGVATVLSTSVAPAIVREKENFQSTQRVHYRLWNAAYGRNYCGLDDSSF